MPFSAEKDLVFDSLATEELAAEERVVGVVIHHVDFASELPTGSFDGFEAIRTVIGPMARSVAPIVLSMLHIDVEDAAQLMTLSWLHVSCSVRRTLLSMSFLSPSVRPNCPRSCALDTTPMVRLSPRKICSHTGWTDGSQTALYNLPPQTNARCWKQSRRFGKKDTSVSSLSYLSVSSPCVSVHCWITYGRVKLSPTRCSSSSTRSLLQTHTRVCLVRLALIPWYVEITSELSTVASPNGLSPRKTFCS